MAPWSDWLLFNMSRAEIGFGSSRFPSMMALLTISRGPWMGAFAGAAVALVGRFRNRGTWLAIMLAYAIRRLPYALRSCMAALQQVHISLEEAAESVGANKMRSIRRVLVPLMTGGILAGFVTSFITAAVELSATIMLVSADSQAPMSYGIYLYMQSVAGRGPGAALGVLAILVVAIGTYLSHRVVERTASRLAPRKEHSS